MNAESKEFIVKLWRNAASKKFTTLVVQVILLRIADNLTLTAEVINYFLRFSGVMLVAFVEEVIVVYGEHCQGRWNRRKHLFQDIFTRYCTSAISYLHMLLK